VMGLIGRMSCAPARILGRKAQGTLAPGSEADVSLIDPGHEWVLDVSTIFSKSNNSPFLGWHLIGRSVVTFVGGACAYWHPDVASRLKGFA